MAEFGWLSADILLANWYILIIVFIFGLCVGSFLNVVVYRLPKMMEQAWRAEAQAFLGEPLAAAESNEIASAIHSPASNDEQAITLSTPASSCRQCGHRIRWYENIPLISWLVLRGKCSACGTAIGIRYPLVELVHAALWVVIALGFGITPLGLAYAFLATALFTLFWIDWDTQLLPDDITLPLLWAGLLFNLFTSHVRLSDAVLGAVAGYGVLWAVFHLFRLVTGKEGMGYGDFKLLGALGAWFGWMAIPPLLLASSLGGAVFGIALMAGGKLKRSQPFAFGPFLALAGLAAIFVRPERWLSGLLG
jgi:leader peptidase (prepilin peptidase) / N-methyltransferase